jgi:F-type H+-transporting ATPase subunit gamma
MSASVFQQVKTAVPAGVRTMATLKQISMRLKSVSNIQKITKSMKMVSSAKFKRAEKMLKSVKPIGSAAQALQTKGGVVSEQEPQKRLIVPVSSDRGLCGGIHSGVCRSIRTRIANFGSDVEYHIATVGDKTRGILARTHSNKLLISANEVGRLPPTFDEASFFASEVLAHGFAADSVDIVFNKFRSAVAYDVTQVSIPSVDAIADSDALNAYDDVDSETLKSYQEFNLAANVFYAMVEGQASEQSARMSAMENATNNAGEMIDTLQLTFNRTRQAVITRELIEIISGAAALD